MKKIYILFLFILLTHSFGAICLAPTQNNYSIKDITEVENLIEKNIPEDLRDIYNTPQGLKPCIHFEGPTLKYHLQQMLNSLNNPNQFKGILTNRQINILKNKKDVFINFILLHDIGKDETKQITEDGIRNPGHSEKSIEIIEKYNLASEFKEMALLKEIILLHMTVFKGQDINPDIIKKVKNKKIQAETFEMLILACILDSYWNSDENKFFNDDLNKIKNVLKFLQELKNKIHPGNSYNKSA